MATTAEQGTPDGYNRRRVAVEGPHGILVPAVEVGLADSPVPTVPCPTSPYGSTTPRAPARCRPRGSPRCDWAGSRAGATSR